MIDITNANHAGLSYLQKAIEIFEDWKESKRASLTPETFLACLQTMKSIPKLADHLQKKHGFSYLLPGKLMSDPIKGRFGWYRQVHGENFFMSVKQLFLAEKKIRCLSLLQEQVLKSASGVYSNIMLYSFQKMRICKIMLTKHGYKNILNQYQFKIWRNPIMLLRESIH